MRQESISIFKFEELSDESKETAREWWRSCENQDCSYSECVYEDAATIADLFGLDIRQRGYTCQDGKTRYEPSIFYSGFSSQGDGACFEGDYSYKKGSVKAVKQHAPQDTELHSIVESLFQIQMVNFFQLSAKCCHSGHYQHSGCMNVETVRHDDLCYYGEKEMTEGTEDELTDTLRLFADWIYKQLEQAYNYTMSDENVDECIVINDYEFTEDGSIH